LGSGSTFHFSVTLEPSGTEHSSAILARLADSRVLVLGHDAAHLEKLTYNLTARGAKVFPVTNGRLALRMLKTPAGDQEPFQAVVIDLHTRPAAGLTLGRAIRKHFPLCLPVILMASSLTLELREKVKAIGFTACLIGRVKPRALLFALAKALEPTTVTAPVPGPIVEEFKRSDARVLIAEDNTINQFVIRRMLERLGYETDIVSDGLEAVNATKRVSYGLVFMDCQMPEMDGLEATAAIRALEIGTGRHTPIIALTANALDGDREHCVEAGMDDYLAKPVRKDQLAQMLRRWIRNTQSDLDSHRALDQYQNALRRA
jgi:two-component system sensor histidine kinase/response regulator